MSTYSADADKAAHLLHKLSHKAAQTENYRCAWIVLRNISITRHISRNDVIILTPYKWNLWHVVNSMPELVLISCHILRSPAIV